VAAGTGSGSLMRRMGNAARRTKGEHPAPIHHLIRSLVDNSTLAGLGSKGDPHWARAPTRKAGAGLRLARQPLGVARRRPVDRRQSGADQPRAEMQQLGHERGMGIEPSNDGALPEHEKVSGRTSVLQRRHRAASSSDLLLEPGRGNMGRAWATALHRAPSS
jgi:hypothetical protein